MNGETQLSNEELTFSHGILVKEADDSAYIKFMNAIQIHDAWVVKHGQHCKDDNPRTVDRRKKNI